MYFRQRIDLLWGRQRVFVVIQSTSVWPRFAQPCAQNQNRCINSLNVAWTAGKFSRVHFDSFFVKVHIFWEGHKIFRNLHLTFDYSTYSQKLGKDFAKFCGLLIYMNFTNFYTYFLNKTLFYSIFVGDPVSCKWKIMPQKLKVARNQAVMMQLSTGFSCNNNLIDVV